MVDYSSLIQTNHTELKFLWHFPKESCITKFYILKGEVIEIFSVPI